ncbi:hypothetical protein AKJ63_00265 [candidate division MSBL1 archaeon SCGC-AAA259D18]|uniref:Citrate transporter-like domain-containing protein n=1 Tax=candidate division MSBL1 archaeon SCGC-AAA259D18 TaxID=1698262 RepID=A0A133UCN5_9EURY|nr:hypothetical protein AKJ63_00265 [candidate division MSBL1 archaeon SCGC-AAA259D18]
MELSLLISAVIFVATYGAIISGRVQRSVAAMVGAVLMVVAGLYFGFYTEAGVIEKAIDWNTIGLLLGMMLIVGVLEDTGLFEALSIGVSKLSKGRYFYMIVLFGLLTAVSSTTIDNVTTILLVTPITLSICSELEVDPRPILLVEVLFSNVGGVATLVGDPPNIMISGADPSYLGVPSGGFSYMDFIHNLAPTVIICVVSSIIAFKLLFAEKAQKENSKIKQKALRSLLDRDPTTVVKDWGLLKKSLSVLFFVILLFVVHHELGLMPASVALIGAALILLLTRPNVERIVSRVKWTTLLFFAGLFVIVHGVSETGLLTEVATGVMNLTSGSIVLSTLAILFVTAFGSAIVDNIPFTAAMIPVVGSMSNQLGMGSSILWWALALGAGFGGNGTYLGSSAGVIAVKMSEDHGSSISFKYWFKYGAVVMLITAGIAALMLTLQIITGPHIPFLPG